MKYRCEYPLYAFYDHTGMARHLEKMAQKGWMLEKIHTNSLWRYRRIKPQTLHFAVTYFPHASDFDAAPGEDQQEFYDLCEAAGWQFVAQTFQIQVFCNAQKDPVPLDTDPKVQVENIHEAMCRNYMWGKILSFVISGGILLGLLSRLEHHPLKLLSTYLSIFLFLISILLALHQGLELAVYYRWHRKALRLAQEEHRFLKSPSLVGWGLLFYPAYGLAMVPLFFGSDRIYAFFILAFAVATLLCYRLAYALRDLMKRRGLKTGWNRGLTFLVTFLLVFGLQQIDDIGLNWVLELSQPKVEYTYEGEPYTAYCYDLPLTIGDLTGADDTRYSNYLNGQSTFLAGTLAADQHLRRDAPLESPQKMFYLLHRSSIPFVLADELRWYLDIKLPAVFSDLPEAEEAIDPAPFGAEEAWYRYHNGYEQYLLRFEDRILQLGYSWEPTEDQLKTSVETLLALK